MTHQHRQDPGIPRRRLLLGAGIVGAALAGCSTAPVDFDSNEEGTKIVGGEVPSPSPGTGGILLAATTAIPVGGGMIFPDDNMLVTQPTAGQFKGFYAYCTHLACMLDKIADGKIYCPCHGSTFSVTDGAALTGPATQPLPPVPIKVTNGNVMLL